MEALNTALNVVAAVPISCEYEHNCQQSVGLIILILIETQILERLQKKKSEVQLSFSDSKSENGFRKETFILVKLSS